MNKYEYILLDCDKDASKEEVLENIKGEEWTSFESRYTDLGDVADKILEENYVEWEVYEEGEGVCLAVKKAGDETFEVFWAVVYYTLDVISETMFSKYDFIEESCE